MVKKKRIRIGPIGNAILVTVAVSGTIALLALFPNLTLLLAPFVKKKKYSPRQAIYKNIESLIHAGLLQKKINSNGSVELQLTKKGRWEAVLRAKTFDVKTPKWDGVWRIVIFDIPETKLKIRNELRRAMIMYGFKLLQKSVWVYPYTCDDFVDLVKTNLGIAHDVLYMKVSYIENDRHLRREFNLT